MNKNLIFVALSLLVWGIGEGIFYFFQPLYLQEFGADPVQIGGILGLVGLSMAVVHIPAGYLADRYGRRPLLWAAWIIGTIATWILALADTLPFFIFGMVIYGFTAFVAGPLSSYVTAAKGNWSVGRALTLSSAAFNTGMIIGPLIGGWLGNIVGLRPLFYLAAIFFIISTGLILIIQRQPIEYEQTELSKNIRPLLNRKILIFLILTFFTFFFLYLPQPLTQNYLRYEKGLNLNEIGQLLSMRSIGVVVLNLTLGQLSPHLGYLLSQVSVGVFSLLIWRGAGNMAYRIGFFFLGGYQTSRILANAQMRDLVDPKNMGVGYGLVETIGAVVVIVAPPISGLLYIIDPILPYLISLIFIIVFFIINSTNFLKRNRAQSKGRIGITKNS